MKILASIDGSNSNSMRDESDKKTKQSKGLNKKLAMVKPATMRDFIIQRANKTGKTVVHKLSKYHKVKYRIEFGNPKVMLAHDMPDHIKADLIVISRTGLNAVERIRIGSTANYVATHAKIPVLIV